MVLIAQELASGQADLVVEITGARREPRRSYFGDVQKPRMRFGTLVAQLISHQCFEIDYCWFGDSRSLINQERPRDESFPSWATCERKDSDDWTLRIEWVWFRRKAKLTRGKVRVPLTDHENTVLLLAWKFSKRLEKERKQAAKMAAEQEKMEKELKAQWA